MTAVIEKTDAALSAVIQSHSFISSLTYFESISSTNAYALDACQVGKIKPGALVIADHQQAGKGRFQNSWESKTGEDILMSLVLEPHCSPDHWAQMSFPLGLAVRNALKKILNQHVSIELKWPNDILVGGHKCVGMLHAADVSTGCVILGLGINVNQESQLTDRTSLKMVSGKALNRWRVLNEILTAIGTQLDSILSSTIDADAWNTHAAYLGKPVQVLDQALITGEFRGIDPHGAALIQTSDGIKRTLVGANFRLIDGSIENRQ